MSSCFLYLKPFNFLRDVYDTPDALRQMCVVRFAAKKSFFSIAYHLHHHQSPRARQSQMNARVSKLSRALSDEQDANILLSLAGSSHVMH
jgi:hypothetical protein